MDSTEIEQQLRQELAEARQQFASTVQRYELLYNLAPIGHLAVNEEGAIAYANDMALEILGLLSEELPGKRVVDSIAAADRSAYERFQQALFAGDEVHVTELRVARPANSSIYVELRGRRMLGGEGQPALGFIVVADVSERRQMHDALRRRNRELAALNRFAYSVSSSFEVEDVLTNLQAMLVQSYDIEAGLIAIYDAQQDELRPSRYWGAAALTERLLKLSVSGSQIEQAASRPAPLFARHLDEIPWLSGQQDDDPAEECPSIFLWMVARGHVEGAIWLFMPRGSAVSDDQLAYFGTLAQQAGVAIRSARLFADVRRGKERLRKLTHEIVSAQEEERRRVARELHDEAGQLLTALKLSLEMLSEELQGAEEGASVSEFAQKQLASAVALSERAMAHIRGLVHNLRPTALDDLGLNTALEGLCHDFSQSSGVQVRFHQDLIESPLANSIQIVAYRFLQEALTNASKHAHASEVQVLVQQSADGLRLLVEDDGVGFDPHAVTEDGLGILGMRERLESVGGELEISSQPGHGTRLEARIPIDG